MSSLEIAARIDLARLEKTSVEGSDSYATMLAALLRSDSLRDELDSPEGRALLRAVRYAINKHRNELWDRLVRRRNLFFATMVVNGTVAYALLGLAIAAGAREFLITAAVAFYLAAAAVGLFKELYSAGRERGGGVNDYGLGLVQLMAIPVISGFAGLGGVLLTRMAAISDQGIPALDTVFSLAAYPYGLVVAAIFGLSPGLLLERVRAQTEAEKGEIARSGVGDPQAAWQADDVSASP